MSEHTLRKCARTRPTTRETREGDPWAVVHNVRLPSGAKRSLLQGWAHQERQLEVAEGEGMGGGRPSRLSEVLCALQRLPSHSQRGSERAQLQRAHGIRPSRGLAWLVVAALAMPGCQALDPYTGESRVNKTTKGAAVGALAGAAAGALTGRDSESRRKRALIGAGVGVLAGGAVGAYMDRQAARLRQELAATGVSVTRAGDEVILNMPGDITFATDSADLRPQFYDVLNSVARVLEEFDKTLIRVSGHTDSTGSEQYNQALSERRAESVARYLVAHDIRDLRVEALGFGDQSPVASNASVEGRQRNRRVELVLAPLTEPS